MFSLHYLLLTSLVPLAYSFLMGGGGGGGGCGCAMPTCAPSAPPPCPAPSACPCATRAAARGEKTLVASKGMDALELQAVLMGVDLANPYRPVIVVPKRTEPKELKILGEDLSKSTAITPIDRTTNSNYSTEAQDFSELKKRIGSEIRFSPVKKMDEKLEAAVDNATLPESTAVLSSTPLVVMVDEESSANSSTVVKDSTTVPTTTTTTVSGEEAVGNSSTVDMSDSMSTTAKEGNGEEEHGKCNSQVLKKLIIENITNDSNDSKKAVNIAAEHQFGGSIDVVCSRGHFSYVYTSSLFCEASKGEVTCIAFRQST